MVRALFGGGIFTLHGPYLCARVFLTIYVSIYKMYPCKRCRCFSLSLS